MSVNRWNSTARSRTTSTWTLSFEVPDHSVTVTGDGVVLVDGDSVERELPV